MAKKWLNWFSISIAILCALCLIAAGIVALARPSSIEPVIPAAAQRQLPKNTFELPIENYTRINTGLLDLKTTPPSTQLPNLRNALNYYGKNGRPDADKDIPLMHFSLVNSKEIIPVLPQEKIYLTFDRMVTPPKYIFSPNNAPTPLWIEVTPYDGMSQVKLFLLDDGQIVNKPAANAEFMQQEKEFARYGGAVWEMGKWRVDGTLLARQKARWYGQDLFFDKHGGKEFGFTKGKQRIDFGEGDEAYSVFVNEQSCIIWKDNRWQNAEPGEQTKPYPIMCVKKIDTRLINFELWDVNGKGKMVLNMLKSSDTPLPRTLQQTLKFVGARTLTKFLFEVNKERIQLRPNDWLLFKDNRWQLLTDPATIQRYVDRQLIGPLFVFEGVSKKDDRQVLKGTMYNPTRTEALEIEIPLVPPGGGVKGQKKDDKKDAKKKVVEPPKVQKTEKQELEKALPPATSDGPLRIPSSGPPSPLNDADDGSDDDDDDEDTQE
ncbi:MAG: hypothetical protein WC222_06595 [Parachlamydiales bacterium]|jgi:hypothetical protein